jgi:hypothetical protein
MPSMIVLNVFPKLFVDLGEYDEGMGVQMRCNSNESLDWKAEKEASVFFFASMFVGTDVVAPNWFGL